MRTRVVFHLNVKATQLALGGIYFLEERSRNVLRVSDPSKPNWAIATVSELPPA